MTSATANIVMRCLAAIIRAFRLSRPRPIVRGLSPSVLVRPER